MLDKSSANVNKGETLQLNATVLPENANNTNVTWSSNNTSVATVTNGVVSAIKKGTATITVETSDGGYTASCIVTVTQPVTGITITPTNLELNVGQTYPISVSILPSDADNQNYNLYSENTSIATINNGIVEGISEGTTNIVAVSSDSGYEATCKVVVVSSNLYKIKNGNVDIKKIMNGNIQIKKIYNGSILLFSIN